MENKNIATFCGCKPSQKAIVSLIKILLALIKKHTGTGQTARHTEY